jgi:hypothetical protein
MDNLSAYPVLLSFLSYLKFFIGRLGSHPYQLVRGNIMSTDVDSSSIICANFGYYLWLSTNSSRHGKAKLVVQVRAGAINQQSSIHNSYDENHIQERLSPPICIYPHSRSILQGWQFSRFFNGTFSNAQQRWDIPIVRSYTVPFVSAGIQPTLYQCSSSRLISFSIGAQVNFYTGHSSLVPVSKHTNVDANVDCYYSDALVYYRQCYIACRKLSSVYIICHQVLLYKLKGIIANPLSINHITSQE